MKIAITHLKKFKKPKKKLSEEQVLAGDIYEYFGRKLLFPRIMKIIKEKGKIFVREVLEEIRKGDPKDRLALFIWKCKNVKVKWEEKNDDKTTSNTR